jgi:hypothetical protein
MTIEKLTAIVKTMAEEHNKLEVRVLQLENYEKTRQRLENERVARKQIKNNTIVATQRNAALEAELS